MSQIYCFTGPWQSASRLLTTNMRYYSCFPYKGQTHPSSENWKGISCQEMRIHFFWGRNVVTHERLNSETKRLAKLREKYDGTGSLRA